MNFEVALALFCFCCIALCVVPCVLLGVRFCRSAEGATSPWSVFGYPHRAEEFARVDGVMTARVADPRGPVCFMETHLVCGDGDNCSVLSVVRHGWYSIVKEYEHAIIRFLTMKEANELRLVCREFEDAVSITPFRVLAIRKKRLVDWLACFPNAKVREFHPAWGSFLDWPHRNGRIMFDDLAAIVACLERSVLTSLEVTYAGGGGAYQLLDAFVPGDDTVHSLPAALKRLELRNSELGSAGACDIANGFPALGGLTALILPGNSIDDHGMLALAAALPCLRALETLDLRKNRMSATGIEALAAAFSSLPGLRSLDLGQNRLGSAGAHALSAAFRSLPALESLTLDSCEINNAGARDIASALPALSSSLTALELSKNKIFAAGALALAAALPKLTRLACLRLRWNPFEDKGTLAVEAALPHLVNLETLVLGGNRRRLARAQARDRLSVAFAGLTKLQELRLDDYGIDGDDARALSVALRGMPELVTIDLSNNHLYDKGIRALAKALPCMPNLKVLLLGTNFFNDSGALAIKTALRSCTQLADLDLQRSIISYAGLGFISELALLVRLETLSLRSCIIHDTGAEYLAAALPSLVNLSILDLFNNLISGRGALCLAKALPSLTKLKKLNLKENSIDLLARGAVEAAALRGLHVEFLQRGTGWALPW